MCRSKYKILILKMQLFTSISSSTTSPLVLTTIFSRSLSKSPWYFSNNFFTSSLSFTYARSTLHHASLSTSNVSANDATFIAFSFSASNFCTWLLYNLQISSICTFFRASTSVCGNVDDDDDEASQLRNRSATDLKDSE